MRFIPFLAILVLQDPAPLKTAWTADMGGTILGTPLVEEGVVYAATLDGKVCAFKLESGEKVWEYTAGSVCAPLVMQKKRICIAQVDGTIVGLELTTGKKLFEVAGPAGTIVTKGKERLYSSGSFKRTAGGGNAVGAGRKVTSIDTDKARAAWSVDLKWGIGPITEDGDKLYAGDEQGSITCLEAKSGKTLWTSDGATGSGICTPIAISKERAVGEGFGGSGKVLCVNTKTGKKLWTYEPKNTMQAGLIPPVIFEGKVFVPCFPEVVCLDLEKGTKLWSKDLGGYSNFTPSGPAVGDGKAFLLHDGKLTILELATGKTLAAIDIETTPDATDYPQPTWVDGKVVYAAGGKVQCLVKP